MAKNCLVTNSCGELKTENFKIHLRTPKDLVDFRDRKALGGFISWLKSSMKGVFIASVSCRTQRASFSVIEGKGGALSYDIKQCPGEVVFNNKLKH